MLALRTSDATLLLLAYNEQVTASVSGLLREAIKVAVHLLRIKIKNPDANAAAFLPVKLLWHAASLLMAPPAAASWSLLSSTTTGPLGATLLHPTVYSALAGLAHSLADAVIAASSSVVYLAGLPVTFFVGITVLQQLQGQKHNRPLKDAAELSNNPRFK